MIITTNYYYHGVPVREFSMQCLLVHVTINNCTSGSAHCHYLSTTLFYLFEIHGGKEFSNEKLMIN